MVPLSQALDPMIMCKRCGQRPVDKDGVSLLVQIPLLVTLGTPVALNRYCKDCAGQLNFLGLLVTCILVVAVFVILVITFV
jgi:hypothetical protein